MSDHPTNLEDARVYLNDNAEENDNDTIDYSGYSQLGIDTNEENNDKDTTNSEKKIDNLTIQTGGSTIWSIESGQELQFANFNKAEEEKAREQQYQVNNDEIKKIMQEMKWKPKRVMHGLKP